MGEGEKRRKSLLFSEVPKSEGAGGAVSRVRWRPRGRGAGDRRQEREARLVASEREMLAAWREAMRVWMRGPVEGRRGRLARHLAGLRPDLREALLVGPEAGALREAVEELLGEPKAAAQGRLFGGQVRAPHADADGPRHDPLGQPTRKGPRSPGTPGTSSVVEHRQPMDRVCFPWM